MKSLRGGAAQKTDKMVFWKISKRRAEQWERIPRLLFD